MGTNVNAYRAGFRPVRNISADRICPLEKLSMRKITWNSDKVLSISAFVVSIATLLALLFQVKLAQNQAEMARKGQKASVLPYVEIWPQRQNSNSFSLSLVNNGIGPAFIDSISILADNKVYHGDPYSFYWNVIVQQDTINYGYSNVSPGQLVPAGARIDMMETNASQKDADLLVKWFGSEGKATVVIKFSSVYGDQWVTEGILGYPKLVKIEEE